MPEKISHVLKYIQLPVPKVGQERYWKKQQKDWVTNTKDKSHPNVADKERNFTDTRGFRSASSQLQWTTTLVTHNLKRQAWKIEKESLGSLFILAGDNYYWL